jgi:hypothetical protein
LPKRRAALHGGLVMATAPGYPERAPDDANMVCGRFVAVRYIPVGAPLPHVSVHVMQPQRVGRVGSDFGGLSEGPVQVGIARREDDAVTDPEGF